MNEHILHEKDIGKYLKKIQDNEVNYQLDYFLDNQWRARMGDGVNGWEDWIYSDSLCGVVTKLVIAVLVKYPESQLAVETRNGTFM